MNMKAKNIATVNNSFSELTRVSTRFLILGIVLIVLKGLNTLKVLKALKFTFDFDANRNNINSVVLKDINLLLIYTTYPVITMIKSRTFHPSLRYAFL
jgi:hypothetical protein